jgi:hypothetical protein
VLITSVLVVRVAWSLGSPADLLPFGIEDRAQVAPKDLTREEDTLSQGDIEDILNEDSPQGSGGSSTTPRPPPDPLRLPQPS